MSPEAQLVAAQLEKAEQKLAAARTLLVHGHYEDAVSRAYYAVFHAATALLLTEGLTADSHAGLKALFGLRFVQTGLVDRRYAKTLASLMDGREAGDYDVFTAIDPEDARRGLAQAEEFVRVVGGLARSRVDTPHP